MKKLVILFLGLVMSVGCFAEIKEVQLSNNHNEEDDESDYRHVVPTVNYDESNVWIKSKELLPNVDIVIKDAANKVIFQGVMPLSPAASVIQLPADNEKYSIELSYDKNNFSGFFEK